MAFIVVQCNSCGKSRVCEIRKIDKYVLHCRYCGVQRKLKKKNECGLALNMSGPYRRGIDAMKECKIWNLRGTELWKARNE